MDNSYLKEFEADVEKWRHTWESRLDPEGPIHYEYPPYPPKWWFNKWAEETPDKPYILMGDIVLPYGVCNDMSRRIANALLDLGVKKGDRVAIMAPNVPQYVLALQALFKTGMIEVPTNPLYTIPELAHQFADSGTETVIVMAMFASKAIELLKDPKSPVKRVIYFQVPSGPVEVESGEGIYDLNELLANASNAEPDIEVTGDDIARLQYTGGTTGVPKGCVLTHAMIMSQAIRTSTISARGFTAVSKEDYRTLGAIPLNHVYGFNFIVSVNLYTGGNMVLVAVPNADNLLEAIQKNKPTIFAAVPAMIIGLINHPDIANADISSLKGMFCGSAPLAVETLKEFERLTGGHIIEGYGLSETLNIITANAFNTRKYGSCGLVWPDTDLVIVDVDTGTQVMPRGELGEIVTRGPQVITEYWQNPEETAAAIRGGWLYTGDIGYIDEEGFVFIVDRKKDIIISSGFNVYPRDVEEVLFAHPKIVEACVIGVPDPKRGEAVKAFISLKEGETMTAEEVIAYCRESLAPYKVPSLVEFMDALPRTTVGKADKKALQARG
ncbi:MAG: long-chain-fatty-acid--CoA ligase [Syntrophomonadaceae bacterium]|jgi:long-chain acyl-CoA synthetase|nr:long-chain fatty acid--CoA ligase [Bacillota bacterium]